MSISVFQEELKNTKNIARCDNETLKYLRKPLGRAIYESNVKKEKVKAKPSDRVECGICGKIFTRSGRSNHNKTEYHQLYAKMGEKVKKILLDE